MTVIRLMTMLPIAALALGAACSGADPYAPSVQAACVTHNTAQVSFSNLSVVKHPYDVLFDSAKVATLAPGATSSNFTVTALIVHVVQFNVANTDSVACAPAPVVAHQCGMENYVCRA
jgi:hypothetical protein